MPVLASAISSANDHGYEAGRYVASQALAAFQSLPSLLFVAIGERHNQAEVVRGIRSIAGSVPLIGCCAGNVITMAGTMDKGVGVLALQSADMHASLATAPGLRNQPVPTAEQAMQTLKRDLSALQDSEQATLFVLADGGAGGTAIDLAAQAAASLASSHCTIVGAAAGGTTQSAPVFVNDEVLHDGLAVGLLRAPASSGVGVGYSAQTDMPTAAQDAARQAVAASGASPIVAALIVIAGDADSSETTPAVGRIRDVIGRATPFLGIHSNAAIAPGAGTAAHQTSAVVVHVIGTV